MAKSSLESITSLVNSQQLPGSSHGNSVQLRCTLPVPLLKRQL